MTNTFDNREGGERMRPTPAQDRVVAAVAAHPGIIQVDLCRQIGPHGSNHFGHRAVLRALAAGRVRRETRVNPVNGQDSHYYFPREAAS